MDLYREGKASPSKKKRDKKRQTKGDPNPVCFQFHVHVPWGEVSF